MKKDNARTYDFFRAKKRAVSQRSDKPVSNLALDGWSAYYRWLTELKKRLPGKVPARQQD